MKKQSRSSVRVGVVGAGHWGRNLVRNFDALGALAAVCESDAGRRAEISTNAPKVADYEALLRDGGIDAICIATPAVTHAEIAARALAAGKDVFVEKPLALSAREGEALVAQARAADRILMVGHLLQYHPAVLRMREIVAAPEFGALQYVYSNRLNLGRFRREENILWSFAPHDISVILSLVGEDPIEVTAAGGNYLRRDVADVTVSTLAFPSGVAAHVFVSWLHPYKEQRIVAVGANQMVVFDDLQPERKLELYEAPIDRSGADPVPRACAGVAVAFDATEPLALECQHFLDCVRTRSEPRTDGEEGLRVLRVLQRCQEALMAPKRPDHPGVHATATIDDDVVIGDGTRIWHHAHIMPEARIGARCSIGQNVFVGRGVEIGDDVKIQNDVSVYEGVRLEDGVFCGPSCVFTNVRTPRAEVDRKADFALTPVRRGATIGANATIVCGNEIGAYAFVAAGSVVTHDVAPHALVAGNPARPIGWMCACGERLPETLRCSRCDNRYGLTDDGDVSSFVSL